MQLHLKNTKTDLMESMFVPKIYLLKFVLSLISNYISKNNLLFAVLLLKQQQTTSLRYEANTICLICFCKTDILFNDISIFYHSNYTSSKILTKSQKQTLPMDLFQLLKHDTKKTPRNAIPLTPCNDINFCFSVTMISSTLFYIHFFIIFLIYLFSFSLLEIL